MTSNSDDLHTVLQQNLRLRRQLGAQIAKAKDSSAGPYSIKISKLARWAAKRSATLIHDVVPPFETSGASSHLSPFHRLDREGPLGSPGGAAGTASDNNELEGLRRELMLRRLATAEVPKAGDSGGTQAASDTEDLYELRRQLKLRRELGPESTEAKNSGAKWSDVIAFGSGWILYGTCLAIAGVSAFFMLRLTPEWNFYDGTPIAATISALVFYGLGRDFLYVLSGR